MVGISNNRFGLESNFTNFKGANKVGANKFSFEKFSMSNNDDINVSLRQLNSRGSNINQASGLPYLDKSTLSSGAQNVLMEISEITSVLSFSFFSPVKFVLLDDSGNQNAGNSVNMINGYFGDRGPLRTTVTLTNSQLEKMAACEDFKNQILSNLKSEVSRLVAKNEMGNPNCDLTPKEMETYHMDFWKDDEFWNENKSNKDSQNPNNYNNANDKTYKSKNAINKYQSNFMYLG